MDCRVVVEAAVPVASVATPEEAVRIAIAKTGDRLNPDLNYVEITAAEQACPHCGGEHPSAFIAVDDALVALELAIDLFNVETESHAARIALSEIGQQLEDIPLEVIAVEVLDSDGEADQDADGGGDASRL